MRGMLFYAHSGVRYLVLLVAVLNLLALLRAAAGGRPAGALERRLWTAFTGTVDLQALLGLLLLLQVPFYGALSGHLVMMTAAVAVLHGAAIVDRRRPAERRGDARSLLLAAVVAALLIVGGIMAIGRPLLGSVA